MTYDLSNPDDRATLCAEDNAAIALHLAIHRHQYQEESPCVTTTTRMPVPVRIRTAATPPSSLSTRSPRASSRSSSSRGSSGVWLLVDGLAWLVAFSLLAAFVLLAQRWGGA